jgi:hypothetical protein
VFNPEFSQSAKFRIAHFGSRIWDGAVVRRYLNIIEVVILSVLILGVRCANYQDVFVGGNIYFTDGDCYARMTRVQMCAENPGLIVRHHNFENFPTGTTPHTTALFDYLVLGLSILLKPFSAPAIDLAGALISPLLALVGGWFLWWWSKRMKFRYRWVLLILYGISPILVHGTELGRPDHQSLLILLVTVAICAEWSLRMKDGAAARDWRTWSITSGIAWGLAIWTSAYEPLVLFLLAMVVTALENPKALLTRFRFAGWIYFAAVLAVALLIERRVPSFSIFFSNPLFQNWARTIGELASLSPANPIWLRWTGYLLLATPLLIWINIAKANRPITRTVPVFVLVLMIATYALTIWQARWSYFFILLFALALPCLLEPIKPPTAVWIAFCLSIFPILRNWDENIWPNEARLADRLERRNESVQLRDLAVSLRSSRIRPFLAPWWLSPSVAYWSGQPGIAGSSHESLAGIADSARFFLCQDWQKAQQILQNHQAEWIIAYDSERVTENSREIMNQAAPARSLSRVLERTPAQAPPFLIFSGQNGAFKLYRAVPR